MEKRTKAVSLLPNVITAFGLSCGLFIIFKVSSVAPGALGYPQLLLVSGLLLVAAFADLLDGAVARLLNQETAFGGFFDSLSDAITFGVIPPLVVLKGLSLPEGLPYSFLLTTAGMVYSVCGVMRLVRFSVTGKRIAEDEEQWAAHKKNFTGLPIPAAAVAVVSAYLFMESPEGQALGFVSAFLKQSTLFFLLIFVGYLMVSRLKFLSLKRFRIKVASFRLVLLTAISAVFIFYGFLHYFSLMFVILSWGYIVLALTLSLVRLLFIRKSHALEDFEIESDDLEGF